MTRSVTGEGVRRWCRNARAFADYVGRPLARLLLRPEARASLALDPPQVPGREGSCVLLYAWDEDIASGSALAEGFALPCTWQRDTPHSRRLPTELASVAEHTVELVRDAAGFGGVRWGLQLAEELGDVDLSPLNLPSASVAAPLAAALWIAAVGGRPHRHVLATGAWRGHGFERVEGLEAKVEAVRALLEGWDAKPILFVPDDNGPEASRIAGASVDVRRYPRGVAKLYASLEAHLSELEAEPAMSANLVVRAGYGNRPYHGFKRRSAYYVSSLVNDLADRLRKGSLLAGVLPERIERAVLAVGGGSGLTMLLLLAIRPRNARLLVTPKSRQFVAEIRDRAAAHGVAVEDPVLLDDADPERSTSALAAWLDEAPPSSRAVDITPGTSEMTAILVGVGLWTRARLFYLRHDVDQNNRPLYMTEELRSLDWLHRPHTGGEA